MWNAENRIKARRRAKRRCVIVTINGMHARCVQQWSTINWIVREQTIFLILLLCSNEIEHKQLLKIIMNKQQRARCTDSTEQIMWIFDSRHCRKMCVRIRRILTDREKWCERCRLVIESKTAKKQVEAKRKYDKSREFRVCFVPFIGVFVQYREDIFIIISRLHNYAS